MTENPFPMDILFSKDFLQFVSIILSALLVILGWLYKRRVEEMKILQSQLSERKHKAYADIITTFYSVLADVKKQQETDEQTVNMRMLESKRDIFMYGSDKVFRAFNNWLEKANTPMQFDAYLQFVLSIRKDICGKTKLKKDDILLNLIQDKQELEKFKAEMVSKKKEYKS